MAESHSTDIDQTTREYPELDPAPGAQPPPAEQPAATAEQPHRIGGLARVVIFFGVVFALIVAMCFGLRALNVLPSFDNPFSDKTTDRSQPVLLQSMRDLSRYVAADGNFQVIVDLQEDKNNVPDFLLNQRTLFVGAGSVEEYVDFSKLSTDALSVDEGNKKITIKLPAPEQGQAALDMNRSYVVSEERGLLNRIGDAFKSDPNQQQKVYQLAQQRITDAAKSSGLDQRAQQNTEKMLESLFARLGYTTVTVQFTNP